jgi:hypothetical protein
MRESRTYGSVRGARGNSRPYRVRTGSAALMSPVLCFVQVFGRRQRGSNHALGWPASEKRQGTKSRAVSGPAVPRVQLWRFEPCSCRFCAGAN